MKEVCHRRDNTSRKSLILRKFVPRNTDVIAILYGKQHEKLAIVSYIQYHKARGVVVNIQQCSLYVDEVAPWLGATPDGIVLDPTQCTGQQNGYLEVKCPISCERVSIFEGCQGNSSFCLKQNNEGMYLSNSHSYYYQVQTE